jgi:hypothetical protein
MNTSSKRLIAGGVVAGGLMLGGAGLVIGVGIAKGDPNVGPSTSTTAPTRAPDVRSSLGIPNIDRGIFGNPCPPGL